MPDWFSRLFYEATYWAALPALTLAFSLRFEGRRHLPRRGPALLIANHQSYLDPALVGLASPRHLHFLARKTLFRRPALARLIRRLNAVPVDQEGVAKEGLKAVLEQLDAGRAVVVFPEGHRTRDGRMQPLMSGIHLLIKRSRAPVVPVGIAGAYDALPPRQTWPRFSPLFLPAGRGSLAVSIGRPLDRRRFAGRPREEVLEELSRVLEAMHARAERIRRKRK